MSVLLFLSLAACVAALAWSVVIWRRVRDWRMAALAGVITLLTLPQAAAFGAALGWWDVIDVEPVEELFALLIAAAAFLGVVLVGRVVTDKARVAAALEISNTKLRQELTVRGETQRQLRESERMLATLMRNLPGMVYRCRNDRNWTMEFCSEGCRTLTGYEPEDFLGIRTLSYAGIIHEDDAEGVWQAVQAAVRESRPFQVTYRIRTAGGQEKWVWEQGCAVPSADGFSHLEGFVTDVTESRLIEEQLRQAQKLEVVGRLTGGIAHDFNNLLAIIIGNLELVSELAPEGSTEAKQIGHALTAAERGAKLTRELLAYSRKQILQPQLLDINESLPRLAGTLRDFLGNDIEVETALAGGIWEMRVDPVQLKQALFNLAANARDAMPEGGRLIIETANIRLDEEYRKINPYAPVGRFVMLAVTDTGRGMTEDVAGEAFEPFFTTKEVGKGSGLGLSMVYGFVKQSGGYITIESRPGRGTAVKMYFPRADAQGDAAPDCADPDPPAASGKTVPAAETEIEAASSRPAPESYPRPR